MPDVSAVSQPRVRSPTLPLSEPEPSLSWEMPSRSMQKRRARDMATAAPMLYCNLKKKKKKLFGCDIGFIRIFLKVSSVFFGEPFLPVLFQQVQCTKTSRTPFNQQVTALVCAAAARVSSQGASAASRALPRSPRLSHPHPAALLSEVSSSQTGRLMSPAGVTSFSRPPGLDPWCQEPAPRPPLAGQGSPGRAPLHPMEAVISVSQSTLSR